MTAMFPDSGVPPADARNSLPDPVTLNCEELWYSTSRCQPRFDPAAANAVLAELITLTQSGLGSYDCSKLNQIDLSVKYLIQRGYPHSGFLVGGPSNYTLTLVPPLVIGYTDYLTLVVVPANNNRGASYVSVNGFANVQILRNDGIPLRNDDLRQGRPQIITYYQGYFFFVGLAASQVPLVMTSDVDAWVRTDGSDVTGDGTANTPDKAFRTIRYAFDTVAGKYAASSRYAINIRLGIPGDYEGSSLFASASTVNVIGDMGNHTVYRIKGVDNNGLGYSLFVGGMNVNLIGLTLLNDLPAPNSPCALRGGQGGSVSLRKVRFEQIVANPNGMFLYMFGGIAMATWNTVEFVGNNFPMVNIVSLVLGTTVAPGGSPDPTHWVWKDINATVCVMAVTEGSTFRIGTAASSTVTNVIGKQYAISGNGVLTLGGFPCPGTIAGTQATGGQVLV